MRKRTGFSLLLAAVVLCAGVVLFTSHAGPEPALLENHPETQTGEVYLGDERVPLSNNVLDAILPPNLYEDLSETQAQYVQEVLALVNEARAKEGVAPLTLNHDLRKAAQVRAQECVGTFSHTRPNGTSYKTAIAEAGVIPPVGYSGENVATGHLNPQMVVERWLQSEGHRKNILNPNYTQIGIGLQENVGNGYKGYSWAQLFVG